MMDGGRGGAEGAGGCEEKPPETHSERQQAEQAADRRVSAQTLKSILINFVEHRIGFDQISW